MPDLTQVQKLETKQIQIQTLTQKQILSLNILQLQKAELEQIIEKELETNPVLEEEEQPQEAAPETNVEKPAEPPAYIEKIDYEWQQEIEDDGYLPNPKYQNDEEDKSFEKFVSRNESLAEYLQKQLRLTVNEHDLKIGEFLIGNLSHDGFLRISLEEASKYLNVTEDEVESVLYLLQELGPTGVGSRDLKECLFLQYLEKEMENEVVAEIIQNHLEDLGRNKLRDIARKLHVSIEEVKEASEIIKRDFSPRPAIDAFVTDDDNYVPDPDIIMSEDENGLLKVELNEKGLPRLRRNKYYLQLMMKKGNLTKDAERYLKERSQAAEEFINSIEKRRDTLLAIANHILERQNEFFYKGIRYLKPFTIKETSEKVGVHESTVSRAVNNKYMATPRGMYVLRFFFTTGYTSETGEDSSRESVKDLLRELADGENKKHPYSDQKLVEMLKQKGVVLARRTVTKYREELGIPSASKRKEF
ncbi:MAG: RNA polymerase factor sigma-54 [Candidatus Wallbacteria bacterium]|nr:RNA polymerase factor sigma-54 [Candidatus Wallbacteria bacterium]